MLNRQEGLQLFASGFLGAPISTYNERVSKIKTLGANLMNLTIKGSDKVEIFSQTIDEIYSGLLNRNRLDKHVQLELEFIEESVRLLNFRNFSQWIYAQERSPMWSRTHNDFVTDTINYLITGKRDVSIINWISLFLYSKGGSGTQVYKVDPVLIRELEKLTSNAYLPDIIVRWLSREGGANDFFQSIRLMYGSVLKES